MFVNAEIITDDFLEKALPNEAIVVIDDKSFVLVLNKTDENNYYFEQKEVEIKESYNGYKVVKNANTFSSNTQFLTRGTYDLLGE